MEGKEDAIFVDVPKGGFKVTFDPRNVPFEPAVRVIAENLLSAKSRRVENLLKILLAVASVCALILGLFAWRSRSVPMGHASPIAPNELTPELQQLWGPMF